MKTVVKLTIDDVDTLWNVAAAKGTFKRINPRRPWSPREKVECAKAYLQSLVDAEVFSAARRGA